MTLNTYYKCKNVYEDNLAVQKEIFMGYDFDDMKMYAGLKVKKPDKKCNLHCHLRVL